MVAFYYKEICSYQLVLFEIEHFSAAPTLNAKVKILDITEIYKTSDSSTFVRLLDNNAKSPLIVSYSNRAKCSGEHFCVELDLEGLTKDFPRLVERMCDAIVFLGEVLFAGPEEQ